MPTTQQPCAVCKWDGYEVLFRSLLAGLLREGYGLGEGAVLDAGCQAGHEACLFAVSSPERHVHGLDPSSINIASARRSYGGCSNLQLRHAGLGSVQGEARANPSKMLTQLHRRANRTSKRGELFDVLRVDDLFAEEPLAFAHLDVEGSELNVLQGATRTLTRDQPLLTTEVDLAQRAEATRLLSFVADMGYKSFLVDEACGYVQTQRNFLHIPKKRLPHFVRSPILNAATASGAVFAIGEDWVARLAVSGPGASQRPFDPRPALARWRDWEAAASGHHGRRLSATQPALPAAGVALRSSLHAAADRAPLTRSSPALLDARPACDSLDEALPSLGLGGVLRLVVEQLAVEQPRTADEMRRLGVLGTAGWDLPHLVGQWAAGHARHGGGYDDVLRTVGWPATSSPYPRHAPTLHGVIWHTVITAVETGDALWKRQLCAFDERRSAVAVAGAGSRAGPGASGAVWRLAHCLHGMGHGVLFRSAQRRLPMLYGSYGACSAFRPHSAPQLAAPTAEAAVAATVHAEAEAECVAAPSRQLAYQCAEGLYMSWWRLAPQRGVAASSGASSLSSSAALGAWPCTASDLSAACFRFLFTHGLSPAASATALLNSAATQRSCSAATLGLAGSKSKAAGAGTPTRERVRRGCIFGLSAAGFSKYLAQQQRQQQQPQRLKSSGSAHKVAAAAAPSHQRNNSAALLEWCRLATGDASPMRADTARRLRWRACIAGAMYSPSTVTRAEEQVRHVAQFCMPLQNDPGWEDDAAERADAHAYCTHRAANAWPAYTLRAPAGLMSIWPVEELDAP